MRGHRRLDTEPDTPSRSGSSGHPTSAGDLARTSHVEFDLDDPGFEMLGHPLFTWVFTSQDVRARTEAAGCLMGTLPVHVDLALKAGWNQIGMEFDHDPGADTLEGLTLKVRERTPVCLNLVAF